MRPKTKTELHRAASARTVADPAPVSMRGIGAELKALRKKYPANLRFALIPKITYGGSPK